MARIFLSYRRADSAGFAGRLAEALEAAFGAGSVFRDVDDIRPGEDFVHAITSQLQSVDAVLVMIGPAWLATDADGHRRLDAENDFVRLEIAAALASGKPLIPLLVGGAAMPDEAALPAALAALARRQAVVLTDGGWRDDVARLVASLGGSRPRRARRWLLAAAGVALAVLIGWTVQRWQTPRPPPTPEVRAVADVAGRWTARIRYDWGDEYDERFEFVWRGKQLHGTASYLRGRLAIEHARLDGDWLHFSTRSQEMLGSEQAWKDVTHRYSGQVLPDGIHFTLESGGGYSIHPPLQFIAQRAAARAATP